MVGKKSPQILNDTDESAGEEMNADMDTNAGIFIVFLGCLNYIRQSTSVDVNKCS